jgi:hypothetical protein
MNCVCAFLKSSLRRAGFYSFQPSTEVALNSDMPKLLKIRLVESSSLS